MITFTCLRLIAVDDWSCRLPADCTRRWRARVAAGLTLFAALGVAAPRVVALDQTGLRLDPLPYVQVLAERVAEHAGPFSYDELADAAFVLSGVPPADTEPHLRHMHAIVDHLSSTIAAGAEASTMAEAVLVYMHTHVLLTYRERQTRLDELLRTGVYNCVSSAVLYMILAESLGLQAWGVRTSDHAFCRVRVEGEEFDVETTIELGFDPGRRREFTDEFGSVTGYSYVPANRDRSRREVDQIGLLSLILHNRAAFLSDERRVIDAVGPALDLLSLQPGADSRLVAEVAISNAAATFGLNGLFREGVEFLDRVAVTIALSPVLTKTAEELFHNWVVILLNRNELAEAEAALAARRLQGGIGDSLWHTLTIAVRQYEAHALAQSGLYADAVDAIEKGVSTVGPSPDLLKSLETYLYNQLVQLYTLGDVEGAHTFIAAARERLPGSRLFGTDLAALDRARTSSAD